MAEYIEREALLEDIENTLVFYGRPDRINQKQMGARLVVQRIRCAPAADVAPVVRCRHCQSHHREQEPCHGKTVHYCEKLKKEVRPDFYCGYGKRKEGE